MKPEMKIQHNLLLSLLLIMILSTIGFSQISESNEETIVIPEQVMRQIVRKVLIHYFKPRSQQKLIYLSNELIEQAWLPKIKGIDFKFVDIQQQRYRLTGHFKFANPFADKHSIGFAFGSGGSGYSGDMWHYRVAKQTVKIWKDKDGWGSSGDDYGDKSDTLSPPLPPKKP